MSTQRPTAALKEGDEENHVNAPTASMSVRLAGLSAVAAGIVFAGIQPMHPPDVLASVTTGRWATVHLLGITMCLSGLLGTAGL